MGVKRDHSTAMDDDSKSRSPYIPMFETFKAELDEHHDRRERVIKTSRDVTAASKKIIFALQRVRGVGKPIHDSVKKTCSQHETTINTQYGSVSTDLQGLNAYRYRSISGGNQEFIEAITFQHYLQTQMLMSYTEACEHLARLGGSDGPILLTADDYLLGVFDMVGELMRFAITNMAVAGGLPDRKSAPAEGGRRSVLEDMRELRTALERFATQNSWLAKDIQKKMQVMQQCVEKVETAVYGLIVRGSERPKGWMPDAGSSTREEVESY